MGTGLRAGIAAVLGAAALASPAAAQEAVLGDSPRAGMSIIAFPEREMVEVGGYRNDQEVTVDVIRDGQKIATTTAKAEGDLPETDALEGAIEVNHPGGACWATMDADGNPIPRPNIEAGDRIVATSEGSSDASTVAYVRADDYARYVKEGDTPRRDAEGRYLIHMEGSAMKPDGPYGPEVLEARLVNPARFSNGKRTVRAATGVGSEGTLNYDTGTGRWTAEWWLAEADAAKAVDAEPRIMWLGADPAAETELTIFEFGVGDEGCGAGGAEPDPYPLGEIPPLAPVGVSEAPQNDRVIEVFPSRDFVALAGFKAGETAKVEVWRQVKDADTGTVGPRLIGRAQGLKPNADGEIEINHPGGACWESSAQFPDLRPRDQVRVTAYGPDRTELDINQTTIADVNIREKTVVNDDGDIIVEGNVHLPNGDPWPVTRADELEVRLRSKAFTAPGVNNNKQDLRASVDTAPTDTLTVNADGTFTATFRNKSLAIQRIAQELATEQRIMWLGADPAAGSEGTFFERGSEVVGGPECDPPAPPGSPVRDTPIVTAPGPDAPAQVGPQADGSILVPGLGGLTTLRDPNGQRVLAAQVDAQSLAKLARTGVVSVVLEQKARPNGVLYRFKIRKAGGGGNARAAFVAAAPRGKAIATFWRSAPKKAGKFRFKLKSRALRGLRPGRYVIDVTAANARKKASGKTVSVSFRVR